MTRIATLILMAFVLCAATGTTAQALRGVATHFDAPSPRDAAAGPALREAMGSDWRGQYVTVRANGRSAVVQLTDWCACMDRPGGPTLIDLDWDTFERFAPLSRGVVPVVVSWETGPAPTLPATDTESEPLPSEPPPLFVILVFALSAVGAGLWLKWRTR